MALRHILKISDLSRQELDTILKTAINLKAHPENYADKLKQETLLMLFQKPSLRTRVSFETGMNQLGGHAIFYSVADSPLGKKETMEDTAKCLSRYVNIIMARLNTRQDCATLAHHASVPVINALDDFAHPCQVLADFQTILEKKGKLDGLKFAFVGDIRNNMTYDLMRGAALCGMDCRVSGPPGAKYEVEPEVLTECESLCKQYGGKVVVTKTAEDAVAGVDVVYTDTWLSYHIDKSEKDERIKMMMPWQVNAKLMSLAKPDAIFMDCLPAEREYEVTAQVMDGPQSVVFDEAENRLHAQKALMLFLRNKL